MPSPIAQLEALANLAGAHSAEAPLLAPVTKDLGDPGSAGHCNQIHLVELAGGIRAWWKPVTGTSNWVARAYRHTPNTMVVAEGLAWRIAAILGDPFDALVTPCRIIELDLGHGATWGALLLNRMGKPHVPMTGIVPTGRDQLLAAALFDAVIGNQDRNPGNYLWDGSTARLALIDHSLAFSGLVAWRGKQVLLRWRHDAKTTRLTADEELALETLLDAAQRPVLESCLDGYRMRALLLRCEWMRQRGRVMVPLLTRLRGRRG